MTYKMVNGSRVELTSQEDVDRLAAIKKHEADSSARLIPDAWASLRSERDQKLLDCDWWATSDRTMSSAETAYRKALRDLPSTLNNTTVLNEITWPTIPE